MAKVMGDDFERFVPELLAMARRIFDAGTKAERERLMAGITSSSMVKKKSRAGWGSVSVPVREALIELSANSVVGVSVADLEAYLGSDGPSRNQIRAALKQLPKAKGGRAVNLSRGKYSAVLRAAE
jgi:hypothetical protein